MDRDKIETANHIGEVMADLPSNVVTTPAGGLLRNFTPAAQRRMPNGTRARDGQRGRADVADFFTTALAATRASEIGNNPLKQLDSDLLKGKSGGLARLTRGIEIAAKKEKFKPKIKKIETPAAELPPGLRQVTRITPVEVVQETQR